MKVDKEKIGKDLVDSSFKIHTALGPGLLESAYEACLAYELENRGYTIERQKPQSIQYESLTIETAYRLDIVVNDSVIIELKSVEEILQVHKAQLLTYLRFSKITLGYLINFYTPLIKNGITRMVLNHTKYNFAS
ncbi:MAG: GxxExxY protein [Verrucomicrobiia bacterium Tous-C3TDCM]|nr:MAG: GxxExxY protein [Verrucomicrobiae bacterium Tous-C3TDCM]PAZ05730.1 MAG: GxxExxY protein [Verrucomicrobiae bacterium AMD-G2]